MAQVFIRCPNTGKPVLTGIRMDRELFESSYLRNNSFTCPACSRVHTWNQDEAWAED